MKVLPSLDEVIFLLLDFELRLPMFVLVVILLLHSTLTPRQFPTLVEVVDKVVVAGELQSKMVVGLVEGTPALQMQPPVVVAVVGAVGVEL